MGSASKSKAGIYQKRIKYDNAVKAHLICIFFSQDSLKLRASVNKKILRAMGTVIHFLLHVFIL